MNTFRLMIVLISLAGLAVVLQGQEPAEKSCTAAEKSCTSSKAEAVTASAQEPGECEKSAQASKASKSSCGEKAVAASQEGECASKSSCGEKAVTASAQEPGACSSQKAVAASQEGECASKSSCDGQKAVTASKQGDCASECPAIGAEQAVTVSAQEPGECASKASCHGEKAVTASIQEPGDCGTECPSATEMASQEGPTCCEKKMAKAAAAGEEIPSCCESKLKAVAAARDAQEGCSEKAAKVTLDCMKEMAGEWVMLDESGEPNGQVASQMKVTSGGNVIVETLFPGTEHEMTSVYYEKDGDLFMTHYCVVGNHPTYKAEMCAESGSVIWTCQGGANFSDCSTVAHMHEGVVKFNEDGVLEGKWSMMKDGAIDHSMVFRMVKAGEKMEIVEEITEEGDAVASAR